MVWDDLWADAATNVSLLGTGLLPWWGLLVPVRYVVISQWERPDAPTLYQVMYLSPWLWLAKVLQRYALHLLSTLARASGPENAVIGASIHVASGEPYA